MPMCDQETGMTLNEIRGLFHCPHCNHKHALFYNDQTNVLEHF